MLLFWKEETMNKKLLASLLCSTFLFGVSACSSHDAPAKNEQATSKKTENDKLSSKDSQKVYNRKEEPITLDINNFKLMDLEENITFPMNINLYLKLQIPLHLNLVLLALMNIRTETLYLMYRKTRKD